MTRQPRLLPADLDGDRRTLYEAIAHGPRSQGPQLFALTDEDGALRGPFGGFLLRPRLGDALQRLGAAIRFDTALPDRVREMAVLLVAARWDSSFERDAHEPLGRAAGLTEDEIAALRAGRIPTLDDPYELACVTLAAALVRGDVDDATWAVCVPPVLPETVFELTTLVGYYSTLALQMRAFRV